MLRKRVFPYVLAFVLGLVLTACRETSSVPGGDSQIGLALLSERGCGNCHVIPGVEGADGLVGPPLNDWADRSYIAGTLQNTPENLVIWISSPYSVEPATAMPDLGVTPEQALDMSAYLYTLEQRSGLASFLHRVTNLVSLPAVQDGVEPELPTEPELTPLQQQVVQGKALYLRFCASCHQRDGSGMAGSVPGLRGVPLVIQEDPGDLIEAVLDVHANDRAFRGRLEQRDWAAVLTYMRYVWGPSEAGVVAPDDIPALESEETPTPTPTAAP